MYKLSNNCLKCRENIKIISESNVLKIVRDIKKVVVSYYSHMRRGLFLKQIHIYTAAA
jgi:hypothetical protein